MSQFEAYAIDYVIVGCAWSTFLAWCVFIAAPRRRNFDVVDAARLVLIVAVWPLSVWRTWRGVIRDLRGL